MRTLSKIIPSILTVIIAVQLFSSGNALKTDYTSPPETVEGYKHLWETIDQDLWGGGDVSLSVPLVDGRVVWLYGDTLSHENGLVHSSALVQNGGKLHISNEGQQILPNEGLRDIYWISSAERITPTKIKVTAMPIHFGKGVWNFKRTNSKDRVAILKVDENSDVIFEKWDGWVTPRKPFTDLKRLGPNHVIYENRSHPQVELKSGRTLWTVNQNWEIDGGKRLPNGKLDVKAYSPIFYEK